MDHTLETLNRELLWRQGLLKPFATPLEALARLDGLQAQEGSSPAISLWARTASFESRKLDLLRRQPAQVVRALLHRGTVHMVTLEAYARWAPLLLAHNRARLTDDELLLLQRLEEKLWEMGLVGGSQLARELRAVGLSGRHLATRLLPLTRVAGPEGETLGGRELWEIRSISPMSDEERAEATRVSIENYLRAYGPATPRDATAWSGLTKLRPHFIELQEAGRIVEVRTAHGFMSDLPERQKRSEELSCPGDVEVPEVLLLPDFDNAMLGLADRRRIISDEHRALVNADLRSMAPFLIHGRVAGVWTQRAGKRPGELTLRFTPYVPLTPRQKKELERLGREALFIWRPEASVTVAWAD